MKILKKSYKKGFAKVIPQTLDDLWHLHNLIDEGDVICTRTTREVKVNGDYSRPQKGKRVSTFMCIKVEDIAWDQSLNRLRVHGRINKAPEDIAGRGSYHTLRIVVNKPLEILKERWPKHQIDRIERAAASELLPIIVLSIDSEECCIAMLRQYTVNVKIRIPGKLPGKLEAEKRVMAMSDYFKRTKKALIHLWQDQNYPIVIVGLGFVKHNFLKYLRTQASELEQAVVDVKSVNSGGVAGIREALRSGVLDKTLKHVRIVEETRFVEEVLTRLGKEKSDVAYGFEQVKRSTLMRAVETVLITDFTIKTASVEQREELEELMREVEGKRGKVMVISASHEAGEKLLSLGGIAALLRFPVT